MSKSKGRRKSYSSRNHTVHEIRRRGSFEAEFFTGFNIESSKLSRSEVEGIGSKITDMEPGKEYPIK